MTTNLDILAFLKATQDAHAKEKEEDREVRARERQEDMEHILAVIQRGVQKEVRAAIEPVEERLTAQEKVNQELTKQFNSVLEEMDFLRKEVKSQQEFPALPVTTVTSEQQQSGQGIGRMQEIWSRAGVSREEGRGSEEEFDYSLRKRELCASGRRVVGFTPIEPRMLELQMQSYGAKDM